jgi:hypothetical protein
MRTSDFVPTRFFPLQPNDAKNFFLSPTPKIYTILYKNDNWKHVKRNA